MPATGKISQVIGSTFDAEFPEDQLPKIYNALNKGNERDVQNNLASPDYGTFYNPIQRSIGFVFGTTKP